MFGYSLRKQPPLQKFLVEHVWEKKKNYQSRCYRESFHMDLSFGFNQDRKRQVWHYKLQIPQRNSLWDLMTNLDLVPIILTFIKKASRYSILNCLSAASKKFFGEERWTKVRVKTRNFMSPCVTDKSSTLIVSKFSCNCWKRRRPLFMLHVNWDNSSLTTIKFL